MFVSKGILGDDSNACSAATGDEGSEEQKAEVALL